MLLLQPPKLINHADDSRRTWVEFSPPSVLVFSCVFLDENNYIFTCAIFTPQALKKVKAAIMSRSQGHKAKTVVNV